MGNALRQILEGVMKDRLVTLIGGGGFVGRYVAQALLKTGARVRIVQRNPRSAWFLKPLGGLGQTQFVAGDVRKLDSLARALAGSDAVVNLAGAFGREADAVNAIGAENAAKAAAAAGATAYVQISAIGADAEAQSDYGRSKGEGEALVSAAFPAATILRPSFIFGREDKFVNRFAGLIARAPAVPVLRGAMRMQPVYVADVAAAVVKAVADPETCGGKIFELGGPEVITFTQFHQRLSDAIGRHPPLIDLPDFAGAGIATLGFLPGMPITWDQWLMLQTDNVAAEDGLTALGVAPTLLDAVAPGWLVLYRRHGRFAGAHQAA